MLTKDTDYKMTEMNEMFDRVLRNKSGAYLPSAYSFIL